MIASLHLPSQKTFEERKVSIQVLTFLERWEVPMSADCERFVLLRGGLALPVTPVLLALDLEARGFRLTRDGDDILVSPFSKLTEHDRQLLKVWKAYVLRLLDYIPTVIVQ